MLTMWPAKSIPVLLVTLTVLTAAPSAPEQQQIFVYSPVATYTLPIVSRSGREYVGLLELLEPLGRVSTQAKGASLRLRYNAMDAEFIAGKTQAKIHGRDFDFRAPFLIENSRGLIPAEFVEHAAAAFSRNTGEFSRKRATVVYRRCRHPTQRFGWIASNPPRLVRDFQRAGEPDHLHRTGQIADAVQARPSRLPGKPVDYFRQQESSPMPTTPKMMVSPK